MGSIENDPAWEFLRQSPEQLLAASTKKFDSKKNVWISDKEEGFIAAEIKSTKGDVMVVVTSKGNEKTIKKDEAQQMNPPKFEKTEDMANLTFLNDASVLHNLRQRYFSMIFILTLACSASSSTPTKGFLSIRKTRVQCSQRATSQRDATASFLPSPTRPTGTCKTSMLITGESGAGKTENTKKVISYFAMVGRFQTRKMCPKELGIFQKEEEDKSSVSLEEQIVQTNPVLEAFGNAKTVRNNNSSRFGKFIRIHFNKAGKVAGGDIEHYLLEKSRVIKQAPGERCYHIFYQIYSGAVKGLKGKLPPK
ncbi:myosin head [Cooperia oncophora]